MVDTWFPPTSSSYKGVRSYEHRAGSSTVYDARQIGNQINPSPAGCRSTLPARLGGAATPVLSSGTSKAACRERGGRGIATQPCWSPAGAY